MGGGGGRGGGEEKRSILYIPQILFNQVHTPLPVVLSQLVKPLECYGANHHFSHNFLLRFNSIPFQHGFQISKELEVTRR